MIRWTGLAPGEFEFPFPGSLTSTFYEDPTSAAGASALEQDGYSLRVYLFKPESEAMSWPWTFQLFRTYSRAGGIIERLKSDAQCRATEKAEKAAGRVAKAQEGYAVQTLNPKP